MKITKLEEKALNIARKHFEPIMRNNGRNYFEDHIMNVYKECKVLNLNEEQLVASILHDMYEDTSVTKEYIVDNFGKTIEKYVDLMTIRDKSKFFDEVKKATDNEFVKPVRFADRYSNLKQTSIKENSVDFMKRILYTTEMFYIPNFDGELKSILENECKRIKLEIGEF